MKPIDKKTAELIRKTFRVADMAQDNIDEFNKRAEKAKGPEEKEFWLNQAKKVADARDEILNA